MWSRFRLRKAVFCCESLGGRTSALILLSFVLLACGASRSQHSAQVAFFLYDAGETFAMEPVLDRLKEMEISTLVFGVATAQELMKHRKEFLDLRRQCGVQTEIVAQNWHRDDELSPQDVQKIESCFVAPLLIVGMASRIQAQVAQAVGKQKTSRVWAYFDSFSPMAVASASPELMQPLVKVLVPSDEVRAAFQAAHPSVQIKTVGNPTLERWREIIDEVDRDKLRVRLDLDEVRPVLLYAGGYGEDYEDAFRLFVRATLNAFNYQVIVSLHPRVDGQLERRILGEELASHITIIPKGVSTAEALAVSSLLVSHRSTTGVQAVFAGKPTLYLDTERGKYSNIAIDHGLALQVFSESEFKEALDSVTGLGAVDMHHSTQIPRDSSRIIAELIERDLAEGRWVTNHKMGQ